MITVSHQEFEKFIDEGIASLPERYVDHLQNIAFIIEEDPSEEQRQRLQLQPYQTLFGLYEGVPLSQRQGMTKLLPDKITIYQHPLQQASANIEELREKIRHTVWHEVAHIAP